MAARTLAEAYTGAACFNCYRVPPAGEDPLKKCGGCERAWFCNIRCQKAVQRAHKSSCKLFRTLNSSPQWLQEHAATSAPPAHSGVKEVIVAHMAVNSQRWQDRMTRLLEVASLHTHSRGGAGHLSKEESNMITLEAHCVCCLATRVSCPTTLKPCPKCHWDWRCEAHLPGREHEHSEQDCNTYQRHLGINLFADNFFKTEGEEFSWQPDMYLGPDGRPKHSICDLPVAGWGEYLRWRDPSLELNRLPWELPLLLTKMLGQALTAVIALRHFYGQAVGDTGTVSGRTLASLGPTLVLHVIGAGPTFELSVSAVWEEVLHLVLPECEGLANIDIVFVGPDVAGYVSPSRCACGARAIVMQTCPHCRAAGRQRRVFMRGMRYEEYVASDPSYVKPHLALVFNSGIHDANKALPRGKPSSVSPTAADGDELDHLLLGHPHPSSLIASWSSAVAGLLDDETPLCFTAWSEQEISADQKALEEFGARVTQGAKLNPYQSLVPYIDPHPPCPEERFFFQNKYLLCIQGRKQLHDDGDDAEEEEEEEEDVGPGRG